MYLRDSEFFSAAAATSSLRAEAQQWHPRKFNRFALAFKRATDIVGALTFFTLFLPLYVAIGVGVRLASPGPVLFSQNRVGRNGRQFEFYKFRSMLVDSDEVLSSFLDSDHEATVTVGGLPEDRATTRASTASAASSASSASTSCRSSGTC